MAILTLLDSAIGKLDEWYFRYHRHINRTSPAMFYRGWGSHAALASVNRHWSALEAPSPADIHWEREWLPTPDGVWSRSGSFPTPLHREHLPSESARAYVQFVRPTLDREGAVAVMLQTSREEGVTGRIPIARALARRGISTMLLESPYMGRRKPLVQHGVTLQYFSDFLVLCAAAIEEARAVLGWLSTQGFQNLCTAGVSKGGYLAAVAGLRTPATTHVVALVPPDSGVSVFVDGLLGQLCDWDLLQRTSGSRLPVKRQMIDLFAETSLERRSVPESSQRLTLVAARRDRYVPSDSYERLARHWGAHADIRWLGGGHVSTIAERHHLIDAITDTLLPLDHL
jgi:hypothetical protein